MYRRFLIFFLLVQICFHQDVSNSDIELSPTKQRYITDEQGNILMYVNIWGHVKNPGIHLVHDGIDLASLLSKVGGPLQGANLKEVKLFREIPDQNNQIAYRVNLDEFYRTGIRNNFIDIKPNDTVIIPQKYSSYILSQAGSVSAFLSMLNLYLTIWDRYNPNNSVDD